MGLIQRLNEKLNYNQEMFILSFTMFIIFAIPIRFIAKDYFIIAISFSWLCFFFTGIFVAYWIYNRNDDKAYGYKVRDKIRRFWKWFMEAEW